MKTLPRYFVVVYPGENIQTIVDANPAGTTFLLKSGIHWGQTIQGREGDIFQGEDGTVLAGGRVLSSSNMAAKGLTTVQRLSAFNRLRHSILAVARSCFPKPSRICA